MLKLLKLLELLELCTATLGLSKRMTSLSGELKLLVVRLDDR